MTEQPPTLTDLLTMIETLGTSPRLGREWRRTALALTNTAQALGGMSGLVLAGEVQESSSRFEWAVCRCGNERHEFRRDAPTGRGHWQQLSDALTESKQAASQRTSWDPKARTPEPHLVIHLVTTTDTKRYTP